MIEITDYKSASGSQRHTHLIYGSTPYGDYVQLKEEYKLQDEDYLEHHWLVQVKFNTKILKRFKRKNKGNIVCAYCGKEHLKISHWSERKKYLPTLATADHFWPISKGGDKLNDKNIIPACYKCNNRKSSKILPLESLVYLNVYPNHEDILKGLEELGKKLNLIES